MRRGSLENGWKDRLRRDLQVACQDATSAGHLDLCLPLRCLPIMTSRTDSVAAAAVAAFRYPLPAQLGPFPHGLKKAIQDKDLNVLVEFAKWQLQTHREALLAERLVRSVEKLRGQISVKQAADLRANFHILRLARQSSALPIEVNVPRASRPHTSQNRPAKFVFLARESIKWNKHKRVPDHRLRARKIARKTWASIPETERPAKFEIATYVVAGSAIKGMERGGC
ncbi:hypothetical protein BDZ90DRAFT_184418 [Jaminaea rosea]|uniref:Uncharacterized protein n=1 Tax=Jaminaea rosea TaxID=1569628 RepID=A0A316UP30_9BASI|nr:hypothetical protein BDZ90DRAFT_184418 [Jaminaea rosea]PWN27046.1 hypothetical protein BDZ90DRAFT_184418 [Jaminaea rosea]